MIVVLLVLGQVPAAGTFERKQFDQKKAKEKAAKQQEKEKARMRAISSAPSLSNTTSSEGDGDGSYRSSLSQKGCGSSATSSVSNSGWLKGSGPVVGGRLKAYPTSCGYTTQLQTHNTFNLPCLSKHGNQSIFRVTILPFKLYYYDHHSFIKELSS